MSNTTSKYRYESNKRCREKYKKNNYYGPTSGKYDRRPWNDDEEQIIMFSEESDKDLSEALQRSVGSIQKHRYVVINQGRPWLENREPVRKVTQARAESNT